ATDVEIDVVRASDSREIEVAFATLVRNRADALVVGPDAFFTSRRLQIATLATRHALPAVSNSREFAEAGGLMDYGTSRTEVYRQLGVYAGRVLRATRRPSCRSCSRPSSNSSSIFRPPGPSASKYRPRCSPAPTR